MIFIGIDNGVSGAIAEIREGKVDSIVKVFDMLVIKYETRSKRRKKKGETPEETKMLPKTKIMHRKKYDLQALSKYFRSLVSLKKEIFIVLEYATSMTNDSAMSAGTVMIGYGMLQGIMSALDFNYKIETPQKWQSVFFESGDDTKKKSFEATKKIFGNTVEIQTPRGRIFDGRCDALLLAEYARRKYKNELVI